MTQSKSELLGHISVDSGQIIITDPCYLEQFINNDFQDIREYRHIKTKKVFQFGIDFKNYETEAIYKGKNMNQLIADGEVVELDRTNLLYDYSYNGACNRTIYDKRGGGELEHGMAVASRTGYGDGRYPVIAHYNDDGKVARIEIVFD